VTGPSPESSAARSGAFFAAGVWVAVLLGLYAVLLRSHLLFHALIELFSVVVAGGIFVLAWNTRQYHRNNYLTFIGVAYLFVALLDVVHTIGYKGMGVFPGRGVNLPTQLWIAARYMQSLSWLAAPFFVGRNLRARVLFLAYAGLTALLLWLVFAGLFPDCFLEPDGPTLFKKASEYVICLILAGAIFLLRRQGREFEPRTLNLLIWSLGLTIGAELAFTSYASAYGPVTMIGLYFKLISFYLAYKAILVTGLKSPFELLFRKLKQREAEQAKLIGELRQALAEVKTLSGLLPICASCKKIRDDEGYWQHVEKYIGDRSGAQFSHGLCPECARKLYPELFPDDSPQSPESPK